ncbi:MAG: Cation/cationic drug transporter [Parcubacteria group bacterium GW2011_GWA2_47_26]|nr:MAG: Cation/cationic drug transporter [Parcubacteria group bacterium GW2011_GWA2_47_26]
MQTAIILIITILSNAFANIFIKFGTQRLPPLEVKNILGNLGKIVGNPWILLGALLFMLNFPLYSLLLQRLKLAVAYPLITTAAFAVVLIISVFLFRESLSPPQYIGLILLIVAIWLLAR